MSRRGFAAARDHVLLPFAAAIEEADADLAPILTPEKLHGVLDLVPDEWLAGEPGFGGAEGVRDAYVSYLVSRLCEPRVWARALGEVRREALG